jgi:tetratricopeptide (TPR) repeat protein
MAEKGIMNFGVRPKNGTSFRIVPVLAGFLCAASWMHAQAPAPAPKPAPDQDQNTQNQQAKPPAQANPFPGDTNNVPVLPNGKTPPPSAADAAPAAPPSLPGDDVDPVRSPDEPPPGAPPAASGSSSSSADLANIIAPPPDDERETGKRGKGPNVPEHKETAQDDENVGGYYLDQKNWRAAVSRFESALVLDPENPDVYWGLAESQRHLGDVANAKANYIKVMEYDPDSKHAREAKKLLKEPEMANAPAKQGAGTRE